MVIGRYGKDCDFEIEVLIKGKEMPPTSEAVVRAVRKAAKILSYAMPFLPNDPPYETYDKRKREVTRPTS